MREGIHPEYTEIKATCSCGNILIIKSTLKEDISLDVCSSCHPFYTGKQKLVDTGGRVERFEKRFGKKTKPKEEATGQIIKEDLKQGRTEVSIEAAEPINKVSRKEAPKKAETKKETKPIKSAPKKAETKKETKGSS